MTAPELTPEERGEVARFGLAKEQLEGTVVDPYTYEVITDGNGRPVLPPRVMEAQAEAVRARLAPRPTSGQVKTPDEMVDDLEWSKHGVGQLPLALKEAGRTAFATGRSLARARAQAMGRSTGRSAEQREAEVYLQTELLQAQKDEADIVLDFTKTVSRAIESTASQTQTQARLVQVTYGLAGTGRES